MRRRRGGSAGGRWRCRSGTRRSCGFPAILQVLLFMANQFGLRSVQNGSSDFETAASHWSWLDLALGRLRNPLTLVVVLTLFALLTGFAKPPASIRARWAKLATRLAMGALPHRPPPRHGGNRGVGRDSHLRVRGRILVRRPRRRVHRGRRSRLRLRRARPVPVLALTLLGTHQTEVFSAIREEGYKNFLRLHIAPDGSLTVYALGIDRVVKDWDLDPDNPDNEASYLKPPPATRDRRPTHRPDIVRSELGVGGFTSTGGR